MLYVERDLICRIGPQKRQIRLPMKQSKASKETDSKWGKKEEESIREGGGGGGSPWRLRTPILVARENKPYFRPQNISRRPAKYEQKVTVHNNLTLYLLTILKKELSLQHFNEVLSFDVAKLFHQKLAFINNS
jgi:hypothetical protein